VAIDVSQMDLSLELLGQKIEMPILICPTGSHALAHPDGELATARAAGARKTIMAVSSASSYPLEKISLPRAARCGGNCGHRVYH
jgi:isopentenyl diphosphate isomerase/L-lactate dehydrogenase-like FMN-dependent dehydrogenase